VGDIDATIGSIFDQRLDRARATIHPAPAETATRAETAPLQPRGDGVVASRASNIKGSNALSSKRYYTIFAANHTPFSARIQRPRAILQVKHTPRFILTRVSTATTMDNNVSAQNKDVEKRMRQLKALCDLLHEQRKRSRRLSQAG